MKSIVLKIKAKHLAEEAKIIRNEERKAFKSYMYARNKQLSNDCEYYLAGYNSLRNHRRAEVRIEARATQLTRMFLQGRAYSQVESTSPVDVPTSLIDKVSRMAFRYLTDPYHSRTDVSVPYTKDQVTEAVTEWFYRNV